MQAKPNFVKICPLYAGLGKVWSFSFSGREVLEITILKVINNNVVTYLDEDGQEVVAMGRGLGFKARPGDPLPASAVEKLFRMDTPEESDRLKNLFSSLSPNLLALCARVIDHAGTVLSHRLNRSIYLTLPDHIQFAISRKDHLLPNPLLTEVRVFYPQEYALGCYALELIRKELSVNLPDDEAASIALHIVNAEYDGSMSDTMRAVRSLKPITALVESWPELRLDRNRFHYDELLIYLKCTAMHAFSRTSHDWDTPGLAEFTQRNIPAAYACAGAVLAYLSEQSGHQLCSAEQALLAICIFRACRP